MRDDDHLQRPLHGRGRVDQLQQIARAIGDLRGVGSRVEGCFAGRCFQRQRHSRLNDSLDEREIAAQRYADLVGRNRGDMTTRITRRGNQCVGGPLGVEPIGRAQGIERTGLFFQGYVGGRLYADLRCGNRTPRRCG